MICRSAPLINIFHVLVGLISRGKGAMPAILLRVPSVVYTYIAAGIILYIFAAISGKEKASPSHFLRFCFPVKHWFTHSTKVDVAIYLINKVTQRFVSLVCQFGLALIVALLVSRLKTYWSLAPPFHETKVTIGIALVLIFVMADFGEFFSHYIQHKVPFLWEFHKVHHSARFLTPLTTTRSHPVSNLLDGTFIALFMIPPIVIAEMGFNLTTVRIMELEAIIELVATLTFLRQLQHSHFRISFGVLDKIVISPLMHHVHHSAKPEHWNKNFGSRLSIWDWCFGSAFVLPKCETLDFGLGTIEDERGDYSSILTCYIRPLIGCVRELKISIVKGASRVRADESSFLDQVTSGSAAELIETREITSGTGTLNR